MNAGIEYLCEYDSGGKELLFARLVPIPDIVVRIGISGSMVVIYSGGNVVDVLHELCRRQLSDGVGLVVIGENDELGVFGVRVSACVDEVFIPYGM